MRLCTLIIETRQPNTNPSYILHMVAVKSSTLNTSTVATSILSLDDKVSALIVAHGSQNGQSQG